MTYTGTIGTVLLAVFLVASAGTAIAAEPADDENVIATSLETRTNPLLGEGNLWDGSQTFGYIYAELCWEPGGFNPLEESWTVSLDFTDDTPDWMILDYPTEGEEVTPAILGSSAETECGEEVEFELVLNSDGDIEYEHSHTFNFGIVVEGPDTIGTYNKPDDKTESLSITTDEEPEDMFPEDDGEDDGTNDDGGTQGDEAEEGPAPVFAVFALLAVGLVALARRRR